MSKSFFEGFIVSHFNVVLHLAGTPQLFVIQGEDVMILHQQFVGMLYLFLGPLMKAQQVQGSHQFLFAFLHTQTRFWVLRCLQGF